MRMRYGKMLKSGDVILAQVQFTDTFEIKKRPAVVLYEEYSNVVIVGITSNLKMEGIPLKKEEGAIVNSIIKLNYIFTISSKMVVKKLFSLKKEKKKVIYEEMIKRLEHLIII